MNDSEKLVRANKMLHDFDELLKGSGITYCFSVGKDNTFISSGSSTSTTQMTTCLASIISGMGSIILSNGYELHQFAELLTEATNMAFEKLGSGKKEGKLIVGPWREKV